jgi:uncharacterized protein YbaP (TraB family)
MPIRTTMACMVLLLLLGLLAPCGDADEAPAQREAARPLLYVAVGPHATHVILGTLHISDTRVSIPHPLVARALSGAAELVAELAFDPAAQMGVRAAGQLPRNRPLETVLGPALTKRVTALLKHFGRDLDAWQRTKPWLLEHHLGELLAPKATRDTSFLDARLQRMAKERGIAVVGLETAEEQTRILDDYPLKVQVAFLEETVSLVEADLRDGTNAVEDMIQAWRSGDAERLLEEVRRYYDFDLERDRRLFEQIHDARNERMLTRLAAHVARAPDRLRLVAVGAAHLPGTRGMLRLLEDQGYALWRVRTEADLPRSHAAALVEARRRETAARTAAQVGADADIKQVEQASRCPVPTIRRSPGRCRPCVRRRCLPRWCWPSRRCPPSYR